LSKTNKSLQYSRKLFGNNPQKTIKMHQKEAAMSQTVTTFPNSCQHHDERRTPIEAWLNREQSRSSIPTPYAQPCASRLQMREYDESGDIGRYVFALDGGARSQTRPRHSSQRRIHRPAKRLKAADGH